MAALVVVVNVVVLMVVFVRDGSMTTVIPSSVGDRSESVDGGVLRLLVMAGDVV